MARRTPLFQLHRSLGARLIEFGGWEMPLHYGSQLAEHHAVRRAAGVFDVSHMGIIDVQGRAARALLERLLANDVGKLTEPGAALYSCMLNEAGGVVDDVIAYWLGPGEGYRVIVNAATRDSDVAWMRAQAGDAEVQLRERAELGMLAVQGPAARERFAGLLRPDAQRQVLALERFHAVTVGDFFVARTGYTGEDGFEVILPAPACEPLFRELLAHDVIACGLAARDTLRLEAGLNLYGHDMDAGTHPLECGLGWTVAFEPRTRDFIGRVPLERVAAQGSPRKRVGVVLEDRGVLREHQKVLVGPLGSGEITSGTFSPTLQCAIALARVPRAAPSQVEVDIRGRHVPASIVTPPFVRHGRSLIPPRGAQRAVGDPHE